MASDGITCHRLHLDVTAIIFGGVYTRWPKNEGRCTPWVKQVSLYSCP